MTACFSESRRVAFSAGAFLSLRSSGCFRLVFAHSADHNQKSADYQFGARERVYILNELSSNP